MPVFSEISEGRLATCDDRLQRVLRECIKAYDFTILCGHRNEVEQAAAVKSGRSQAPWPTSNHNYTPSRAVDIAPYPINWSDISRFRDLAHLVIQQAGLMGVKLRWGGDFKKLRDYPHFELVE